MKNIDKSHNLSNYRIVYYHMISDINKPYYEKNKGISPSNFDKQISYLKKRHTIITIKEAINRLKKGKSLKNYLSITTDDGFRENYNIIAPILIKHKIRATFFLTSNCIDNKNMMWRNKLMYIYNTIPEKEIIKGIEYICKKYNIPQPVNENLLKWSKRTWPMDKKEQIVNTLWKKTSLSKIRDVLKIEKPYMTKKQIRELNNKGFEFESHTNTHPLLSKITYDEIRKEIQTSTKHIEEITQKKITSISYPFGNRPKKTTEDKLFKTFSKIIFFGTKGIHQTKNIQYIERINMEYPYLKAILIFKIIDIYRKLIRVVSNY